MPRITITISDRQHELLQALSKFSGKPMSTTVSELLESTTPVMERMATVFQAIYEQRQKENERIKKNLTEAHDALEPMAMKMLDQFDMFMGKVAGAADCAPASPSGLQATTAEPAKSPPTNRGVTTLQGKTGKSRTGKASGDISTRKKPLKKAASQLASRGVKIS